MKDWREPALVLMARVLGAIALLPVVVGYFADPERFLPFAPLAVFLVAACLAAGFVRRLTVEARAWILVLPLFLIGVIASYRLGPNVGVGLILALVTVMVGLVRGLFFGVVALVITTVGLTLAGYAGRGSVLFYMLAELPGKPWWARTALLYSGTTGLLLLLVTRAVQRIEQALAELRAHEQRLKLTLEASRVAIWSVDRAGMAAHLKQIPIEDRARVGAGLDETLAGRAATVHLIHRQLVHDEPVWVETRGRLLSVEGHDVLIGTVADISARRRDEERRDRAEAALLRLSSSNAAAGGDLTAALREITEIGSWLLDVERCSVWLLRHGDGVLECCDLYVRSRGTHTGGTVLTADRFPNYLGALRRQRVLAAEDTLADERTRELLEYHVQYGIKSLLDAPIHVGGRVVGVMCHEHTRTGPRAWSADDEIFAGSLADCASRALEAAERARAEKDLQIAYGQLGQLTRGLEAAKEQERRRIAHELHDELGGALTAIRLHLRRAAKEPATAAARLEEADAIIDRSIRVTRELSRAMRPPLLDEIGLVPALQVFVDEQARASGLPIELEVEDLPGSGARPSPEIEIATFRIVQEALTNVLRHAAAHHVTVRVTRSADDMGIIVRDDGRGFDAPAALRRTHSGGLGLVGMRERARSLGGSFDVRSGDQGTEIRVELPARGAA